MTPTKSSPRARYQQHMRQRQTTIIGGTASVLAALVVICTFFWLNIIPFPFDRGFSEPPKPVVYVPCVDKGTKPVDLAKITVRVYNAGDIEGLAGRVAQTLKSGGVAVSETSNWGGDSIEQAAVIYTSKKGAPAAYTLRAFFPTANVVYDETLVGSQVDVVLGDKWKDEKDLKALPTQKNFTQAMTPIEHCTAIKDIPDNSEKKK